MWHSLFAYDCARRPIKFSSLFSVSLGLIFLDLPMGLRKFVRYDHAPSKLEIESQIRATESINCRPQSVFICICLDEQIALVKSLLKKYGYSTCQTMVIHKHYKSDKVAEGGFVSAALFMVIGFRNVAVMKHALYPTQDPIIKLQWQQNVWTVSRSTPAVVDANGNPINQCPQPPMIVERFIHLLQGILGPGLTVFSGGECGMGFASVFGTGCQLCGN